MPYARNADLPERVRNMFGAKGQEAYRKAFIARRSMRPTRAPAGAAGGKATANRAHTQ
jgi:cation transport regulator ChaB